MKYGTSNYFRLAQSYHFRSTVSYIKAISPLKATRIKTFVPYGKTTSWVKYILIFFQKIH